MIGCLDLDFTALDIFEGRASFLRDPRNNGICGPSSCVFGILTVHKPLEGGEALNFVLLSELLVNSGINLSQEHGRIFFGKNSRGLCVLWGELLAVTAPRCVEFHKKELMLSERLGEIVICEDEDTFFHFGLSKGNREDCA